MLSLARKLREAVTSKKTKAADGMTVEGALIDDDGEAIAVEGHIMHVGEDGTLDMGNMDRSLGASDEEIKKLPSAKVASKEALGDQTKCAICQDGYEPGEDIKTLPCGHLYHLECVDQWLQVSKACPLCEKKIATD
eukprot:TRINITY_DN6491_c0_g1_i1.p1 TRINITY_DN6491_c0_g1~~TRINITY_DN6491_c0_g1_i1.p1  ORF type:complete len:136 (-),score=34.87 TRINITY_DN6491_c0_g1_i1:165-572(-)